MSEHERLVSQLNRYCECVYGCGRVLDAPRLAEQLRESKWGIGMLTCPECGSEGKMVLFPSLRFTPVFEMMVECYQTRRAVLVLILAQTAFEGMLDDLLFRLLEKMNCPDDVQFAIANALRGFRAKDDFVKHLTGKSLGGLATDAGWPHIMPRFDKISRTRNSFLHTAEAEELGEDDMNQALAFACDTVDLYAALCSTYREQRPLIEPDWDLWGR